MTRTNTGVLPRVLGLLLVVTFALPVAAKAPEKAASKAAASKAKAPPKVGDVAPDFKLMGTDGKTYKLSDFKGKAGVVVAWYPVAGTRG